MRKPLTWPGISAPHGAHVMDAWDGSLRLGALPLPLFINGHGYFVQAAHVRLGVSPLAVHATYSLDNHDSLAKTQVTTLTLTLTLTLILTPARTFSPPPQRFPNLTLTLPLPTSPQRFREAGLWLADADAYYSGRYLALTSSAGPALLAAIAASKAKNQPPTNIGVHAAALSEYVA